MSKEEADGLKKISISFLRKYGYFNHNSWLSGTITWTHGWTGNQSSVGIQVSTYGSEKYLRIHYTQTDKWTQEKKDFDYKIPLTTTPCHYGGERYWFICPMSRNGAYCGRRVGTLYKDGDYFACRHCYDLTYESRKLSGYAKSLGRIVSIPEVEEARKAVKRLYYKGKPTKKYLRFLKLDNQAEMAWLGMAEHLNNRSEKLRRKGEELI